MQFGLCHKCLGEREARVLNTSDKPELHCNSVEIYLLLNCIVCSMRVCFVNKCLICEYTIASSGFDEKSINNLSAAGSIKLKFIIKSGVSVIIDISQLTV